MGKDNQGMRDLRNDFQAQLHDYMIRADVMASGINRVLDDKSVVIDDVLRRILQDALNDFYKARG